MGEDNRRLLLLLAVCLHQAVMFTSGHDHGDHSNSDTGSVSGDEKNVTASRLNSGLGDEQNVTASRLNSVLGDEQNVTASRLNSGLGDEQNVTASRLNSVLGDEKNVTASRLNSVLGDKKNVTASRLNSSLPAQNETLETEFDTENNFSVLVFNSSLPAGHEWYAGPELSQENNRTDATFNKSLPVGHDWYAGPEITQEKNLSAATFNKSLPVGHDWYAGPEISQENNLSAATFNKSLPVGHDWYAGPKISQENNLSAATFNKSLPVGHDWYAGPEISQENNLSAATFNKSLPVEHDWYAGPEISQENNLSAATFNKSHPARREKILETLLLPVVSTVYDVCGLSSSLGINDGSDPRCYRYVRPVNNITWVYANRTCNQYQGHVVSLNTEEEWRRVADFWNINVTDNVQYLMVGLREHLTRRYSYVPVWQWHDQTVAYYLNVSWHNYRGLSRPYCAVFRKGERHLTIVSCYTRIRASFLCEIPKNTRKGSPRSSPRSPTNSLRYPASLSRPASALPHMTQCPNQEVTYTVLGCPCQGSLENKVKTRCLPENPLLKSTTHVCDKGWGVHVSFLCNHIQECPNGDDENHCIFLPCHQNQFGCRENKQCFPRSLLCDGKADCKDESDETNCEKPTEYHGNMVLPPAIINLSVKGKFSVTSVNISQGDPVCPETHFQCPGNGYSLPVYVRCNGVRDCPMGEDEVDCAEYRCPGFYRCRDSPICVHADHVCDGLAQCPKQDDELMCGMTCPSNCACVGFAFVCGRRFSANLYPELRYVEADYTGMNLQDFATNHLLSVLRLRHCGIRNIGVVTLPNLLELDLSYNFLKTFTGVEVKGMNNLRSLYLAFNELLSLNAIDYVNVIFPRLRILDMSGGSTREISNTSFHAFPALQHLNLSRSQLQKVQEPGFSVLTNLKILDLSECSLTEIHKGIFKRLPQVHIIASQFQLCCPSVLPEGFNPDNCHAPFNEVSSCAALLRTGTFRVFLVIYAVFALVGNFLSFVYRVFGKGVNTTLGFDIFVTHLCVSDFLMGVYLAIVGIADRVYYGNYEWNNTRWKQSIACQAAGFLSFLSSEVSAFLICFITLERFLVTRFPLRRLRFSHKWAQAACVAGWVMGVLLASVPFFPFSSPWDFYSQTGICIPLPITGKAFPGSDYSFFLMIVFNFVLFLVIAVGQLLIVLSVRSQSKALSSPGRTSKDGTIARRLLAVAMTDFLCWFPIGLLGLMARSGIPVSDSVSVAMAIFVLPLNSALNPFLYTFHVLLERCLAVPARQDQTSTKSKATNTTCSARGQGESSPVTVREQAVTSPIRDMLSRFDSMVGKSLDENMIPPEELQLRLTWMIKDRNRQTVLSSDRLRHININQQ